MKTKMLVYCELNKEGQLEYFLVNPRHRWATNDDTQIKLDEIFVTFQPPPISENELRQKAITQLRERQNNIRAEATKKIAELDVQIEKLLLIEHKP